MMARQKVVLAGMDGDDSAELELGPFTQGLVFEQGGELIVDVATGASVAQWIYAEGWQARDAEEIYDRVFVQTYPEESS